MPSTPLDEIIFTVSPTAKPSPPRVVSKLVREPKILGALTTDGSSNNNSLAIKVPLLLLKKA